MRKVDEKHKKHVCVKRKKLLRLKRRKRGRKKRIVTRSRNNDRLKVDADSIKIHLEQNGFGESKGETLLKKNNITSEMLKYQNSIDLVRIEIPRIFSMSDNSDLVLAFLHDCYGLIEHYNVKKIVFDHTKCKELGLSASTFMDVVLLAAESKCNSKSTGVLDDKSNRLTLEGVADRDSSITKILFASGLPKHFNAKIRNDFSADEKSKTKTLDVISDKSGKKENDSKTSSVNATKLTQYFQKCLHEENLELSKDGVIYFTGLFGEVLTNCEIHGGDNGTWYTQGVYIKEEYGGEMQLLFMNIGDSIYDGLLNDSSNETKVRLTKLYKRHRKKLSKYWTKEMLYTLFALQDGISRFKDKSKEGYRSRGSGTVTLIEAFQSIGSKSENHCPKMTIISGNTRIVFDEKYSLEEKEFDDDIMGHGKRKTIAFNEHNDIYSPPDRENVMPCKYRFPGTVISLKFVLSRKYIERRGKIDG